MPSQANLWIAVAALILAGGAAHARQCDPYGIDECDDGGGQFAIYWRTIGAVTDTCNNEIFRVYGRGTVVEYPDLDVSQHTDCTWNLVIKTHNGGSNAYRVRAMQPGVRFNLIRLEKQTDPPQPDHHVTFSIGGDYPVESVRILGPFDVEGGAVSTGVTVTLTGENHPDVDVAGDPGEELPSLGLVAVRDVHELRLGGDVGYTNEVKTSTFFAERINILEIDGDLIAQLSVTEADVNGVSIYDLTVKGRMGLEEPEGMLEEQSGDLKTEGTIKLLTVGEVGPAVDIGVGALSVAGFDAIERLVVTDEFEGTGDYYGALTASTIFDSYGVGTTSHQLQVVGDFYGKFTFDEPIADYDDDTPMILIDGALKSGSRITVPEDGLVGQIIPNRANTGAAWQNDAKVIVGSGETAIELTETIYQVPASDIGYGAVGRAEYRLHRESCDPAESYNQSDPPERLPAEIHITGELVLNPLTFEWECILDNPYEPVHLQFYGPVSILDDDPAVKIRRMGVGGWENVSHWFEYFEEPDGELKRIKIVPFDAWLAGSYEITRQPGGLHSRHVEPDGPSPAGINAFTYYLDVYDDSCLSMLLAGFDLNTDDAVTESGDIPAWFVGPVDLNLDSSVDAQDVPTLQAAAALFAQFEAPIYFPGPFVDVEEDEE